MDLLFQRYASPMTLLNNMIRTQRFNEFIGEMVRIRNEESEDKTIWEFWLHRVFDKTYKEFFDSAKTIQTETKPNRQEVEEAIRNSVDVLNGFSLP